MVEEGLNKKSKQKPFQLRDINTGAAHGQQEVPAANSGQYLTLDWWSQLSPAGAQQSAPIVGTLAPVVSLSWGGAVKCQSETKQHVAHKRQLFLSLIHGGQHWSILNVRWLCVQPPRPPISRLGQCGAGTRKRNQNKIDQNESVPTLRLGGGRDRT